MTKRYGRRRVLDDVSVMFPRNSFTLLVGANGSGKTTLLRLLSTFAEPDSGTIHWVAADGSEIRDRAQVRARVGYAGHAPLAWDELTVRENVELQLRLRGREANDAQAILQNLKLSPRSEDRADTLSRGLKQRLSLAMATVHRPDYLLLDEPLSNLDQESLQQLVALLRDFSGNATTIVATHDPKPLQDLADRTVRLHAGQAQEEIRST